MDGIKYRRLGPVESADKNAGEYHAQALFEQRELTGYLSHLLDTEKSLHEKVVYHSATEKQVAEDLEKNPAVKLYAKLPGWFTIATPLGSDNPDWAVVVLAEAGAEKLFFVVETKGRLFDDALRDAEVGKIMGGGAHFAAITAPGSGAKFVRATSVGDLEKCW